MIRDMFKDMPIVSSLLTLIMLVLVLLFIDGAASKPKQFYGILIDKHYEAETNSIGTGIASTSNGGSAIVVTSSHSEEKFLIIVKTEGGKILTAECEPELYYKKKISDKIGCIDYKGFFTNCSWSIHAFK